MRRSLDEVSGWREIEPRARRAPLEQAGEIERGLIRAGVGGAQSKIGVGRVMRRQLPGRVRRRWRPAGRLDRRTERGFRSPRG